MFIRAAQKIEEERKYEGNYIVSKAAILASPFNFGFAFAKEEFPNPQRLVQAILGGSRGYPGTPDKELYIFK